MVYCKQDRLFFLPFFPHNFQSMQQPLQKQSSDKSLQKKIGNATTCLCIIHYTNYKSMQVISKTKENINPSTTVLRCSVGQDEQDFAFVSCVTRRGSRKWPSTPRCSKNPHCHFSQATAL